MDLEDLVKVRSAKHLLHLIKSKLLPLLTQGWGNGWGPESAGRRVEGPGGVGYEWSLLNIEHSEATPSELNPLSLTTGEISSIK